MNISITLEVLWTRGQVILFVREGENEIEYSFSPEQAKSLGATLMEKGRLAGPPPLFSAPLRLVEAPRRKAPTKRRAPRAADEP